MPIADPDPAFVDRFFRLLQPWHAATRPLVLGAERVPSTRPIIFIGNHCVWGIFDAPVLLYVLWKDHGILPRALGDHSHWQVPVWRDLLQNLGVVDGNRSSAGELLSRGQCLLIFPGGGREVAKRRGEKYRLIWKERLGFAFLAIRHGATVVPVSALGGEEMLDVVYDAHDLMASPLAPVVKRLPIRQEIIIPLARGLGGLPLPRPERLYFHFGEPVAGADFSNDEKGARALRDRVKHQVEDGLRLLADERARDPLRSVRVRMADAALSAGAGLLRRVAAAGTRGK